MSSKTDKIKVHQRLVEVLSQTPYLEVSVPTALLYAVPRRLYVHSVEAAVYGGEYMLDCEVLREIPIESARFGQWDYATLLTAEIGPEERQGDLKIPLYVVNAYQPKQSLEEVAQRAARRLAPLFGGTRPAPPGGLREELSKLPLIELPRIKINRDKK